MQHAHFRKSALALGANVARKNSEHGGAVLLFARRRRNFFWGGHLVGGAAGAGHRELSRGCRNYYGGAAPAPPCCVPHCLVLHASEKCKHFEVGFLPRFLKIPRCSADAARFLLQDSFRDARFLVLNKNSRTAKSAYFSGKSAHQPN